VNVGDALVEIGIAVASSAVTVIVFAWRSGRFIQSLQDRVSGLEKSQGELKDDFDESSKNSEESWRTLNRTLGQIEGALGVDSPTPRRRAKSWPGPT
jgi:hypothetical protein